MDFLAATTTDANPPRYALESDDEDEFNPLPQDDKSTKVDIKFIGNVNPQANLIVARGDSGSFWAKGANLGEQMGAIAVNGVQIGLVFSPSWAKVNVIISEAFSQLPVWAMHPYAQAVLDAYKPTTVSLVDVYSVPSYISKNPTSVADAPIRYLSTNNFDAKDQAQPLAPPNLINTTSASFLSIASISSISGILILLPSPNIMKPAPNSIEQNNFTHFNQDAIGWPTRIMLVTHELLLRIFGASGSGQWQPASETLPSPSSKPSRRSDIGDGGMFI